MKQRIRVTELKYSAELEIRDIKNNYLGEFLQFVNATFKVRLLTITVFAFTFAFCGIFLAEKLLHMYTSQDNCLLFTEFLQNMELKYVLKNLGKSEFWGNENFG